ncbi:hypothetical protein V3C99_010699 [Haemonchus contortus]|uniref:G_PROTEIN_RECEP_F1_2 domain-containing protein n=1 Tax=Haemonchus contortus TaxID=6289 RepID=A0A7I5E8A9_HAECO|nr:7TM GPCR domain containing protein [Haemonchus contortus]
MLHPTLTLNLIIFASIPVFLNVISLVPLLNKKKGRSIRDNPSHLPLLILLLIDLALSLLLAVPVYSFLSERGVFSDSTCQIYGGIDMALSLSQVILATIIAFDRYIVTNTPKWGKWRCHSNYVKLIVILTGFATLWSAVPVIGYGKYSTFHGNTFCSLDWRQGDFDASSEESTEAAHHYIAFLTATCLIFFLIPVCIASSFYYSIIDHVDRQSTTEAREENGNSLADCCTWAPKGNVAKVGLGCLLASTLPFLAYSIVCLNPMKSDLNNVSYVVVPVIISRLCPLLNPLLYIWCNPDIVPINTLIEKRMAKRRPPPKTYHTINLIAEVPGMSFPLLTPTVPRRQLPQIPPNLLSPNRRPVYFEEPHENSPMLM